jgi:hypothetical protein
MAAVAPGLYHAATPAADKLQSGGNDQSELNRREFQFSISAVTL